MEDEIAGHAENVRIHRLQTVHARDRLDRRLKMEKGKSNTAQVEFCVEASFIFGGLLIYMKEQLSRLVLNISEKYNNDLDSFLKKI